jgi:hypothetical protein
MIIASTEQLTESGRKKRERLAQRGFIAITQDNQVKAFSVYYNVVLLLGTSNYFDEREAK